MTFAVVCIGMLLLLGIIAAIASHFQGGDDEIQQSHDCASCSSVADGSCKIGCLIEEKKRQKDNKTDHLSVL
jgi:hypothetical protein